MADVDAEFERRGGDQRLELTALEALLRMQPLFARHAAVVRRHLLFAQALGQGSRGALGEAPRIDEYQSRAMLANQLREPVVDLRPDFRRHDGFQRRFRYFERQIAFAHMPGIDNGAGVRIEQAARLTAAHQVTRDLLDRLLRRGQPDARQLSARQMLQAFQ